MSDQERESDYVIYKWSFVVKFSNSVVLESTCCFVVCDSYRNFFCRQPVLAFLMTTSLNYYPVVKATAWKNSELNCRIRKQRTEVRLSHLFFQTSSPFQGSFSNFGPHSFLLSPFKGVCIAQYLQLGDS